MWQAVIEPVFGSPHLAKAMGVPSGKPAAAEPKSKSQEPAAKAKRLKGLRANPDFPEAVSEERAVAKLWGGAYDDVHARLLVMIKKYCACLNRVFDIYRGVEK
jgi:hypothetical protein